MSKTQSHSLPSAGRLEPPPGVNFKLGDRAIIKSNHPLFPGATCTITALPSPNAAIVQLDESGSREHLLLKYIEPLLDIEQVQGFNADKSDSSGVETNQNNSIAPPFGARSDTSNIEELSLESLAQKNQGNPETNQIIRDANEYPQEGCPDFSSLSIDEERERHRLELKVERAFYVISSTKSTTVIRK